MPYASFLHRPISPYPPDLPSLTDKNLSLGIARMHSLLLFMISFLFSSQGLFAFVHMILVPPLSAAYACTSLHYVIHTCTHYQHIYLCLL